MTETTQAGQADSGSAGAETGARAEGSATRPFGLFEWMVARRYISATRKGTGVSLISIIAFTGIALAVTVLIVVMSVMQGFRAKLLDQLLGVNGHVFVEAVAGQLYDYEDLAAQIAAKEGVTSAVPIIQDVVYMAANGQTGGVAYGIRPEDLRAIELIAGPDHLIAGSLDTFGEGRNGGNEIAMGYGLAQKLGVRVGDPVTLATAGGAETPMGTAPFRDKTYRLGAIYRIGMSEYDSAFVYMPLEQAQLFFQRGDAVDKVEVRVELPEHILPQEQSLMAGLDPSLYYTYNWQDLHQSYFNALQTERALMRVILLLILAVAVLNIITGLVMLVKDKTGDIAIMRTLGATRGAIMRIFCLSGMMIGVFGTLLGFVLGVVISLNVGGIEKGLSMWLGIELFPADVYLFDEMPAQLQFTEIRNVLAFALGMSLLSTLYPAWRAASLDPVEALRYE